MRCFGVFDGVCTLSRTLIQNTSQETIADRNVVENIPRFCPSVSCFCFVALGMTSFDSRSCRSLRIDPLLSGKAPSSSESVGDSARSSFKYFGWRFAAFRFAVFCNTSALPFFSSSFLASSCFLVIQADLKSKTPSSALCQSFRYGCVPALISKTWR